MKDCITEYIKQRYGDKIILNDYENKNYCFDIYATDRNINFPIEYKQRYFETGKNDKYLQEYDILIELIQSTPYLKNLDIQRINNNNIYDINISIGWFYKCYSRRLIFFRFLDNNLFDIIDIDFELFKGWFMNNINIFSLQYSNKTTGTINAVVKLKDIPKGYFLYLKKQETNAK